MKVNCDQGNTIYVMLMEKTGMGFEVQAIFQDVQNSTSSTAPSIMILYFTAEEPEICRQRTVSKDRFYIGPSKGPFPCLHRREMCCSVLPTTCMCGQQKCHGAKSSPDIGTVISTSSSHLRVLPPVLAILNLHGQRRTACRQEEIPLSP